MRIGDVAKQLGVSASWLRKLERQGKIPAAKRDRLSKQRRYTPEDLEQLQQFFYGDDHAEGVTGEATAEAPIVELIAVSLAHRHTINGQPYGPGVVQVPQDLVPTLLASDARAVEVGL
jgi:hypothetical protein